MPVPDWWGNIGSSFRRLLDVDTPRAGDATWVGQPEWDSTDYSKYEWMGQPRDQVVCQAIDIPTYRSFYEFHRRFDAPSPVTGLLWTPTPRRLPGELYRCACRWVFPDLMIWVPWCEIHGEPADGSSDPLVFSQAGLELKLFEPADSWSVMLETTTQFVPKNYGTTINWDPRESADVAWGRLLKQVRHSYFDLSPLEMVERDLEQAERELRSKIYADDRLIWELPGGQTLTATREDFRAAGVPFIEPRRIGIVYSIGLTYADMDVLRDRCAGANDFVFGVDDDGDLW